MLARRLVKLATVSFALAPLALAQTAAPAPAGALVPLCETATDLSLWTAESYPAVSGFPAGQWNVAAGGLSVTQVQNGQPTFFHSDFAVMSSTVQGKITVTGGDDDFIGFALGFEPGDSTNASADYLLVDWKGGTQGFNFGSPSCTPGSTANAGLAVSRVFGIPTADEFWGHTNFDEPACSNLNNGLLELARGNTLGATGWSTGTTYSFRFEFSPTNLKVFVDGTLELDVNGTFSDGRMAFYNFSQAGVTYDAFSQGALASWSTYGAGWPGTLGVPSLTLSANPILGTTITANVGNSAGMDSVGCLVLSATKASILTGKGGTLLVGSPYLDVTLLHPLPMAGATVQIPIPADSLLCGAHAYAQMFQMDAGASHGFSGSVGIDLLLGD